MPKLSPEQKFPSIERLIHMIVNEFLKCRRHVPREEAVSAAMLGFCEAHATWNPKKSSYNNWVGFKVRKRLLSMLRTHARTARVITGEYDPRLAFDPESFDWRRWASDSLTEDAAFAAAQVFDPSMDVRFILAAAESEQPWAVRMALREFLADLGWAKDRVEAAFQEVRKNL